MIELAERSPKAVYKMVGVGTPAGTASPSQSTNVGYASETLKEPPLSFLPTPSPTQVPLTCLRSLEL